MNHSVRELGEICTTTQGVQVTKANTSDQLYDGGYRYLYIADFVSDAKQSFIDDNFPLKKVTTNDLVMANTGSPGRVFKGKDGILSNNLFKITFDLTKVSRDYLFYILSSKMFQGLLQQQMKGGIQKHLGHKTIARQKIPLPSLVEQQKISAILDAAYQLRQKDQQLIEHYTALGQSLFLEMFGDPVSNENKYEVVSLDDVTSKVTDGVHAKPEYTESGVPFISVKDVTTGVLIFDKCKFISEPAHEKYFKRCNPEFGDIIYTKVGATYGRAAIVDVDFQFSMYVSVALIKPIRDLINPVFLKEAMSNPAIKRQADKAIKGIGVPDLHLNMIKKFTIPLPPVSEQKKFADYVEKIEQQKKQAQAALEKSDALFNSLLQRAFKGELTQSTVT